MTLPDGYRDPSPEQVEDAEVAAAVLALAAWSTQMLAAIGLAGVELPLDDDVTASLGPALPDWLAEGVARAQALRDLGALTTTGTEER